MTSPDVDCIDEVAACWWDAAFGPYLVEIIAATDDGLILVWDPTDRTTCAASPRWLRPINKFARDLLAALTETK